MITEMILILLTLSTTAIGTITNPTRRVKACIILLACGLSIATMVKAYKDSQDSEFVKEALAAELASSTPPLAFQRDISNAVQRVALKHNLTVVTRAIRRYGALYVFGDQKSGTPVGALILDTEDSGEAFAKYVSRTPLDPFIESAMFQVPHIEDSENLRRVLDQLDIAARIAMEANLSWVLENHADIKTLTEFPPAEVVVVARDGSKERRITLQERFLDSVLRLSPVERNLKVYQECEKQLR
jgi:hypothetical protein